MTCAIQSKRSPPNGRAMERPCLRRNGRVRVCGGVRHGRGGGGQTFGHGLCLLQRKRADVVVAEHALGLVLQPLQPRG